MTFDYEIGVDEYAHGQLLYHRLTDGNKHVKAGFIWIIGGVMFVSVAVAEKLVDLSPILLGLIGVWWIWAGARSIFPNRYLRHSYQHQGLAGERYHAEVGEQGFEVTGKFRGWRVQWPGVLRKGENQHVFILFAANTIFIFGKRYLSPEQQVELRTFASLPQQQPQLQGTTQNAGQ